MNTTQLLRPKLLRSRARLYASQIYTYRLIGWLNSSKKRAGYGRVIRLIADIRRLTRLVDTESICVEWDQHRGLNMPKRGYSLREWRSLFARICKELQCHKVFPQLSRFHDDGKWTVEWRSNARTEWMRSTQADLREQPVTLTDAVVEVVEAATNGFIERIRECLCCQRWFAAALKTQVFCSPECQRKHYWSSSSWKAHRRAYMRRYRRIKSLPNIK